MRTPLAAGGEIPVPKIVGHQNIFSADQTLARPRKRKFNERVEDLRDPSILFQPDSFAFT